MPRKSLTVRFIETVQAEKRTDYWDDVVRGLVLRVSKTGVKSWNVVYTGQEDGIKRRLTLGKFPAVTLEKARTQALKTMASVAEGENPSSDKQARRAAMTVDDLASLYIKKYAKPEKKTWQEDLRILNVEVLPKLGKFKAKAVNRRDILDIIEAKAEEGYVAQSRMVLATVRKMFNWAVERDYLAISPASGLKPLGKAGKRDRVLNPDEIATIWNALQDASFSNEIKDILRLLFLTGQRSGEVCGMVHSEIDLEAGLWKLPSDRTKNGLAHNVPLTTEAMAIVENRLDDDAEKESPLFSRIGSPVQSNAVAQAVRKHLQILNDRWTPHDIRRTVATGMAEIGILPHVIEATLNHVSGFRAGVAGIYNRNAYDREKRNALDRWEAHLYTLIEAKPSKILPFDRKQS